MKYKIVLLVLLIVVLCKACDIFDNNQRTTFSFKNNTTDTLYNFYAMARLSGYVFADDHEFGMIPPLTETKTVETTGEVVYCDFSYDKYTYSFEGKPFGTIYTTDKFTIKTGRQNSFIIIPETKIFGSTAWIKNNLSWIMYDVNLFAAPNDTTEFEFAMNLGNIASGYRSVHFSVGDYYYLIAFKKVLDSNWFYADYKTTFGEKNPLTVTEQNIYQK